MAGSSLIALLDDIATLLDDIAVMTKVATGKAAGVLSDDLALNAEQVSGVSAERELPVVWAVAKGSLVNKLILVPAALILSALAPWTVAPLLMLGGAYLCFEGFEKVAHKFLHSKKELDEEHKALAHAAFDPKVDLVAFERQKIKGAVRTDFILSAEIIVISLGAMAGAKFVTRVASLSAVAVALTAGVYGLVAAIVKLDDIGMALQKRGSAGRAIGRVLLRAAPLIMKFLSLSGTAAMFLVGGGILAHGVPPLHHFIEHAAQSAGPLGSLLEFLANALAGIVAGGVLVLLHSLGSKIFRRRAAAH